MKACLSLGKKENDTIDVFYKDEVISIKVHHTEDGEVRIGVDAPNGSKIHRPSGTKILPKLVFHG